MQSLDVAAAHSVMIGNSPETDSLVSTQLVCAPSGCAPILALARADILSQVICEVTAFVVSARAAQDYDLGT